jgi:hypothetical protein
MMLNRGLIGKIRIIARAQSRIQVQQRYFSAEPEKEASASVPEPTAAELEKGRQQWGIEYNDECLKFEKEWELIARQVENDQAMFLESELGDLQKAKVDMLADKVVSLNVFEIRYLQMKI